MLFQRVHRPIGQIGRWGHDGHIAAFGLQKLCNDAAHVVVIIIVDHDLTARECAGHNVVWRKDRHRGVHSERNDMLATDPIAAPCAPRGDADVFKPEL